MNHQGTVLDSIDGFDIIECQPCGFRHLSPLPTEEETAAYYKTEYTRKRPDYIPTLEEDLEWWRLQYRKKYEVLEGMTSGRDILDVGCGLGRFLETGTKRGWVAWGVEPSEDSRRYAQKHAWVFEKSHYHWRMDAVHLHEVLEHIAQPRAFLSTYTGLLGEGGILCLTVPNDYNPLQMALKNLGYGSYWTNKEHINYFKRSTLCCLLKSVGFEVLRVEMSFPMELFLFFGKDYTRDKSVGRECHKMRMQLDFNMEKAELKVPRLLRKTMDVLNVGREVTVYARKN